MKVCAFARCGLAAAAFFVFAGCEKPRVAPVPKRCVDNQGRVVDDWDCDDESRQPGYGSPHFPYIYHWYYGGEPGYLPRGTSVSGGSYIRPALSAGAGFYSPAPGMSRGVTVYESPSVERGVFGGSAKSFGADAGE